jgi:DNA polymerase-3 subunit alpha
MFNEEFLKFRHFLLNNTFVYVKLQIREGWIRKDTGEKGEPRIQFMEVKLLHEVIPTYAKKNSGTYECERTASGSINKDERDF